MNRLVVIAALLLLTACASSGTQISDRQAAQFQKGVTTEQDVIAELGAPSATSRQQDGTIIIVYAHVDARPDAIDFVPIVGLLAGGATANTTTVSFSFGADGKLTGYTSSNSHADVHTGLVN